ncbi:MAG: hypothetical protein LBT14_04170 [Treponema sp.]|nr:hypothetical protein [Treponema sp.]
MHKLGMGSCRRASGGSQGYSKQFDSPAGFVPVKLVLSDTEHRIMLLYLPSIR